MLAVAISPRGSMAAPKGEATLSRKLSHRRITPTARSGRVLVAEHQVEPSLHSLNNYSRDFVSQLHVGLAPGHGLDVLRVHDEDGERAVEQIVDRLPIHVPHDVAKEKFGWEYVRAIPRTRLRSEAPQSKGSAAAQSGTS